MSRMYIPVIIENLDAESLGIFSNLNDAINILIEQLVLRNHIQNKTFLNIMCNFSPDTKEELIKFLQEKVNGDFNNLRVICLHLDICGFEETWDIQINNHEIF